MNIFLFRIASHCQANDIRQDRAGFSLWKFKDTDLVALIWGFNFCEIQFQIRLLVCAERLKTVFTSAGYLEYIFVEPIQTTK